MIRALTCAFVLFASGLHAQSYKGITLNTPLPETMVPRVSALWADGDNVVALPPAVADYCTHLFFTLGNGVLEAISLGCDGPVQAITVFEAATAYVSPLDALKPRLPTDLDGFAFTHTTLDAAVAQFGSGGLIGGPFGQNDPYPSSMFPLAYDIANSGAFAVFWFQDVNWADRIGAADPDALATARASALLTSIQIMTPDYKAAMIDDTPLVPSAGYTPLQGLFVTAE